MPLPQVFWLVFVPGFAGVSVLSVSLFAVFGRNAGTTVATSVLAYSALFSLFMLVSILRSAKSYANYGWGALATLAVLMASACLLLLSVHALRVHQVQDALRRQSPSNAPSNTTPHTDARDVPAPASDGGARAGGRERSTARGEGI